MSAILPFTAFALAATAAAEFFLLRTLLRMGPELPEGSAVDAGLRGVYYGGLWAMNAAGVLAVASTGLVVLVLVRRRRVAEAALGVAGATSLALIASTWAASRSGYGDGLGLLAAQVGGAAAVGAVITIAAPWRGWRRVWLAGISATYVAAATHYLLRIAGAAGGTDVSLALAEAGAVAVALASPWALSAGWSRTAAIAGGAVALLYTGFSVAHPDIAKYFVIWDSGFGSWAPAGIHAVALFALTYAVVSGLKRRETVLAATGLLLVALGSVKLDYTYYSLIAMSGFLLLAAWPWLQARPGLAGTGRAQAGTGQAQRPRWATA